MSETCTWFILLFDLGVIMWDFGGSGWDRVTEFDQVFLASDSEVFFESVFGLVCVGVFNILVREKEKNSKGTDG
jgi:hypothetical protein